MGRENSEDKGNAVSDDMPEHDPSVLREKIKYLEEELVRKDGIIEKLKKDNELLFTTAVKSSQERANGRQSD